jgi:prepilin-type N-terminal cleavage/methylation domain-containing protein
MNPHRNAFTLLELLVVIAIIAILSAVGFGALRAAQVKAKEVQCTVNLKNLGMGLRTYLNANEGAMFSMTASQSWPITLQSKYVSDWRVYHSPFDPRALGEDPNSIVVSYGMNEALFDTISDKWASPTQLVVAAPAIQMTEGELVWKAGTLSSSNVRISRPSATLKSAGTHLARESICALFSDMHAGVISSTQFTSTASADQQRWVP